MPDKQPAQMWNVDGGETVVIYNVVTKIPIISCTEGEYAARIVNAHNEVVAGVSARIAELEAEIEKPAVKITFDTKAGVCIWCGYATTSIKRARAHDCECMAHPQRQVGVAFARALKLIADDEPYDDTPADIARAALGLGGDNEPEQEADPCEI